MNATVTRLQESLRVHRLAELEVGFAAGLAWAEQEADVIQLKSLDDFWRHEVEFNYLPWTNDDLGRFVAYCIEPDSCENSSLVAGFWRERFDDDIPENSCRYRGFAQGAVSYWRSVKGEVEGGA